METNIFKTFQNTVSPQEIGMKHLDRRLSLIRFLFTKLFGTLPHEASWLWPGPSSMTWRPALHGSTQGQNLAIQLMILRSKHI